MQFLPFITILNSVLKKSLYNLLNTWVLCVHSPFFGEDVHFEVPRDFRTLCFYLFDTDLIGKDTVLGKVSQ